MSAPAPRPPSSSPPPSSPPCDLLPWFGYRNYPSTAEWCLLPYLVEGWSEKERKSHVRRRVTQISSRGSRSQADLVRRASLSHKAVAQVAVSWPFDRFVDEQCDRLLLRLHDESARKKSIGDEPVRFLPPSQHAAVWARLQEHLGSLPHGSRASLIDGLVNVCTPPVQSPRSFGLAPRKKPTAGGHSEGKQLGGAVGSALLASDSKTRAAWNDSERRHRAVFDAFGAAVRAVFSGYVPVDARPTLVQQINATGHVPLSGSVVCPPPEWAFPVWCDFGLSSLADKITAVESIVRAPSLLHCRACPQGPFAAGGLASVMDDRFLSSAVRRMGLHANPERLRCFSTGLHGQQAGSRTSTGQRAMDRIVAGLLDGGAGLPALSLRGVTSTCTPAPGTKPPVQHSLAFYTKLVCYLVSLRFPRLSFCPYLPNLVWMCLTLFANPLEIGTVPATHCVGDCTACPVACRDHDKEQNAALTARQESLGAVASRFSPGAPSVKQAVGGASSLEEKRNNSSSSGGKAAAGDSAPGKVSCGFSEIPGVAASICSFRKLAAMRAAVHCNCPVQGQTDTSADSIPVRCAARLDRTQAWFWRASAYAYHWTCRLVLRSQRDERYFVTSADRFAQLAQAFRKTLEKRYAKVAAHLQLYWLSRSISCDDLCAVSHWAGGSPGESKLATGAQGGGGGRSAGETGTAGGGEIWGQWVDHSQTYTQTTQPRSRQSSVSTVGPSTCVSVGEDAESIKTSQRSRACSQHLIAQHKNTNAGTRTDNDPSEKKHDKTPKPSADTPPHDSSEAKPHTSDPSENEFAQDFSEISHEHGADWFFSVGSVTFFHGFLSFRDRWLTVDCFLNEGYKIFYRVGVSILRCCDERLRLLLQANCGLSEVSLTALAKDVKKHPEDFTGLCVGHASGAHGFDRLVVRKSSQEAWLVFAHASSVTTTLVGGTGTSTTGSQNVGHKPSMAVLADCPSETLAALRASSQQVHSPKASSAQRSACAVLDALPHRWLPVSREWPGHRWSTHGFSSDSALLVHLPTFVLTCRQTGGKQRSTRPSQSLWNGFLYYLGITCNSDLLFAKHLQQHWIKVRGASVSTVTQPKAPASAPPPRSSSSQRKSPAQTPSSSQQATPQQPRALSGSTMTIPVSLSQELAQSKNKWTQRIFGKAFWLSLYRQDIQRLSREADTELGIEGGKTGGGGVSLPQHFGGSLCLSDDRKTVMRAGCDFAKQVEHRHAVDSDATGKSRPEHVGVQLTVPGTTRGSGGTEPGGERDEGDGTPQKDTGGTEDEETTNSTQLSTSQAVSLADVLPTAHEFTCSDVLRYVWDWYSLWTMLPRISRAFQPVLVFSSRLCGSRLDALCQAALRCVGKPLLMLMTVGRRENAPSRDRGAFIALYLHRYHQDFHTRRTGGATADSGGLQRPMTDEPGGEYALDPLSFVATGGYDHSVYGKDGVEETTSQSLARLQSCFAARMRKHSWRFVDNEGGDRKDGPGSDDPPSRLQPMLSIRGDSWQIADRSGCALSMDKRLRVGKSQITLPFAAVESVPSDDKTNSGFHRTAWAQCGVTVEDQTGFEGLFDIGTVEVWGLSSQL